MGSSEPAPFSPAKRRRHPLALTSFIAGLLLCLPPAPLVAIGAGVLCLLLLPNEPEHRLSRKVAAVGIVMGCLGAMLFAIGAMAMSELGAMAFGRHR